METVEDSSSAAPEEDAPAPDARADVPVVARDRLADRLMQAELQRQLLGEGEDVVKVGRYIALERLGSGAMGTVYRAYDPELDRSVALKVLRPEHAGTDGSSRRLTREATALARLNHPNVVTVHEVGMHSEDLFLVMELVHGSDLADWARAHTNAGDGLAPDALGEAIHLLQQAAEGLHAAHGAGIVHRDFKPSNVLIGEDGRARVADFGLARAELDAEAGRSSPLTRDVPAGQTHGSSDTRTDSIVGTPRYMAPEQRIGETSDARSDQFSFCVTAWEVIYGVHPFDGLGSDEAPTRPPGPGRLSALSSVLLRGMSREPQARFASMKEVSTALGKRSATRTRVWLSGGAVGVVATLAAVALWPEAPRSADNCLHAGSPVHELWGEERRSALATTLHSTDALFAEAAVTQAIERIDEHATRWASSARSLCHAEALEPASSAVELSARERCLRQSLTGLAALLEVLEGAGADPEHALDAAWSLPDPQRCDDPAEAAAAHPVVPEPVAEAVEHGRRQLARSKAMQLTEDHAQALATLEGELPAARATGHTPLLVEMLILVGVLQFSATADERGVEHLQEAFELATRDRYPLGAYRAALRLMLLEGVERNRHETAAVWEGVAVAFAGALPPGNARRDARELRMRGKVAVARKDLASGEALLARAVRSQALERNPLPREVEQTKAALANLEIARGDYAAAAEHYGDVVSHLEAIYGEGPSVAAALNNQGVALYRLQDYTRAVAVYERALELKRRAHGADSRSTAVASLALGNVYRVLHRTGEAEALLVDATRILRAAGDEDRDMLAVALYRLSLLQADLGELERAVANGEEALAIREVLPSTTDAKRAAHLVNLAMVHTRRGDTDSAIAAGRRAIELFKTPPSDTHSLAEAHVVLGLAFAEAQMVDETRQQFEHAFSFLPPDDPRHASFLVGWREAARALKIPADPLPAGAGAQP